MYFQFRKTLHRSLVQLPFLFSDQATTCESYRIALTNSLCEQY